MFAKYLRATLVATLSTFALPVLAEGIEVHEAYAIQAMPGGPTAAAFMVIHNHGGAPDHLVSVESDIAERTELHTHIADENGMMQMVEVKEGFDLPTDGMIEMQRGSHHVMFMGVTAPLEDGQTFPLTLVFENAGKVVVDVTVDLDRMTEDSMDHDHMDHGTEDASE
jgi:copper(I)-binding protein